MVRSGYLSLWDFFSDSCVVHPPYALHHDSEEADTSDSEVGIGETTTSVYSAVIS